LQSQFHVFDVNINCEIKVRIRHVFKKQTYKECDNTRCLAVWRGFFINRVFSF